MDKFRLNYTCNDGSKTNGKSKQFSWFPFRRTSWLETFLRVRNKTAEKIISPLIKITLYKDDGKRVDFNVWTVNFILFFFEKIFSFGKRLLKIENSVEDHHYSGTVTLMQKKSKSGKKLLKNFFYKFIIYEKTVEQKIAETAVLGHLFGFIVETSD